MVKNSRRLFYCLIIILFAAASCADRGDTITVITREDGSGTRSAFVSLLGIVDADGYDAIRDDAETTNNTAVMLASVAGDANAIGYVSLAALNPTVKVVTVDGVSPDDRTAYPVSRGLAVVVYEGVELSPAASDFLGYIFSNAGQLTVTQNSYDRAVKIADAHDYAGEQPAGRVIVAGSSSVAPLMEKLAEAYKTVNPNANIEIQQSDSSTGIAAARDGICDFGMTSRTLKPEEIASGLVSTNIAIDAIAVIVHPDNALSDLTTEEIRAIFAGEITDWTGVKR